MVVGCGGPFGKCHGIEGREAKGQGTPEKSPREWLSLGSHTGHMF